MRQHQIIAAGSFVLLAVAVALSACAPAPQDQAAPGEAGVSVTDRDADIQAILDLEQAVFEAERAGNLDAWLGFIDADPVWMPPNEPVMTDLDAIRQWITPFFEQYDLSEETTDREVEVAGDWGYIRAHWTWAVVPKDGGEGMTDSGKSIWVVRRQPDGSWKLARAIWNSDNPTPPAMTPEQ